MPALQNREVLLKIVKVSVEVRRTAAPTAHDLPRETGNLDIWEPASAGDTRVERVIFPVGEQVGVAGRQAELNPVIAHPEFVHDAGARDIDPVAADGVRL